MPTYDYLCVSNDHRFEVIHGINAEGPTACPVCHEVPVRKAFSAPSIHFKGSGWAKKDRSSSGSSGTRVSPSTDGSNESAGSTSESAGSTNESVRSGKDSSGANKDRSNSNDSSSKTGEPKSSSDSGSSSSGGSAGPSAPSSSGSSSTGPSGD